MGQDSLLEFVSCCEPRPNAAGTVGRPSRVPIRPSGVQQDRVLLPVLSIQYLVLLAVMSARDPAKWRCTTSEPRPD